MLQGVVHALDLRRFGRSAQLAGQFVALREARGAERMPFGQKPARRVGDDLAAIGVVARVDERLRAAFRAEPERLVGDQLVVGEAVVQLDDADVFGSDSINASRNPGISRIASCRATIHTW